MITFCSFFFSHFKTILAFLRFPQGGIDKLILTYKRDVDTEGEGKNETSTCDDITRSPSEIDRQLYRNGSTEEFRKVLPAWNYSRYGYFLKQKLFW